MDVLKVHIHPSCYPEHGTASALGFILDAAPGVLTPPPCVPGAWAVTTAEILVSSCKDSPQSLPLLLFCLKHTLKDKINTVYPFGNPYSPYLFCVV